MKSKLGFLFLPWKSGNLVARRRFRLFSRLRRDESGSYLLLAALALPPLIGITGLAVEAGYWLYTKRNLQAAADSAAYSAATAYAIDSTSDLTLQGEAITGDQGLVNGQNGVTVTVVKSPAGGCGANSYAGNSGAIEVIVAQTVNRLFSKMALVGNSTTICARAVAVVSGGGDCVVALGANGSGIATDANGTNGLNLNLKNCSLFSNSTSANAIYLQGNNNVITAETIGAVGGINIAGHNSTTSTVPTSGDAPVADPYKTTSASWPSSCGSCVRYPTTGGAAYSPTASGNPKTASLSPGNFPNGITLDTASATYNFAPGTYYIGGDFQMTKSNITVNGTGVTFIITGNHVFDASKASNSIFSVTAPTSGTMAGVLIWEPTSTGTNVIGNNSFTANIQGIIYAPSAVVDYAGNTGSTSSPACVQILGASVKFGGNQININGNCDTVAGFKKFGQLIALVE